MADKISLDILTKFLIAIENSIKELELKEVNNLLKKTKDIEIVFSQTANTIKKSKDVLRDVVETQIYGKDN
jgi:hypothetical protein